MRPVFDALQQTGEVSTHCGSHAEALDQEVRGRGRSDCVPALDLLNEPTRPKLAPAPLYQRLPLAASLSPAGASLPEAFISMAGNTTSSFKSSILGVTRANASAAVDFVPDAMFGTVPACSQVRTS